MGSNECQKKLIVIINFNRLNLNFLIRGNLGSEMGLIRKGANNKFLWAGIQELIEFQ